MLVVEMSTSAPTFIGIYIYIVLFVCISWHWHWYMYSFVLPIGRVLNSSSGPINVFLDLPNFIIVGQGIRSWIMGPLTIARMGPTWATNRVGRDDK